MKIYAYSETRQKLSKLHKDARNEAADIKGIEIKAKIRDILGAGKEPRSKAGKQD